MGNGDMFIVDLGIELAPFCEALCWRLSCVTWFVDLLTFVLVLLICTVCGWEVLCNKADLLVLPVFDSVGESVLFLCSTEYGLLANIAAPLSWLFRCEHVGLVHNYYVIVVPLKDYP